MKTETAKPTMGKEEGLNLCLGTRLVRLVSYSLSNVLTNDIEQMLAYVVTKQDKRQVKVDSAHTWLSTPWVDSDAFPKRTGWTERFCFEITAANLFALDEAQLLYKPALMKGEMLLDFLELAEELDTRGEFSIEMSQAFIVAKAKDWIEAILLDSGSGPLMLSAWAYAILRDLSLAEPRSKMYLVVDEQMRPIAIESAEGLVSEGRDAPLLLERMYCKEASRGEQCEHYRVLLRNDGCPQELEYRVAGFKCLIGLAYFKTSNNDLQAREDRLESMMQECLRCRGD